MIATVTNSLTFITTTLTGKLLGELTNICMLILFTLINSPKNINFLTFVHQYDALSLPF